MRHGWFLFLENPYFVKQRKEELPPFSIPCCLVVSVLLWKKECRLLHFRKFPSSWWWQPLFHWRHGQYEVAPTEGDWEAIRAWGHSSRRPMATLYLTFAQWKLQENIIFKCYSRESTSSDLWLVYGSQSCIFAVRWGKAKNCCSFPSNAGTVTGYLTGMITCCQTGVLASLGCARARSIVCTPHTHTRAYRVGSGYTMLARGKRARQRQREAEIERER